LAFGLALSSPTGFLISNTGPVLRFNSLFVKIGIKRRGITENDFHSTAAASSYIIKGVVKIVPLVRIQNKSRLNIYRNVALYVSDVE
jgi:hypothetical protein